MDEEETGVPEKVGSLRLFLSNLVVNSAYLFGSGHPTQPRARHPWGYIMVTSAVGASSRLRSSKYRQTRNGAGVQGDRGDRKQWVLDNDTNPLAAVDQS